MSLLSPFGPEHIEGTYRWLSDPELRRQIDSVGPPSEDGNRRYWQERIADATRPTFAVTTDGMHVGNCGLVLDRTRHKAELWIYLVEPRGSGVGTRAVHELLALVFGDLGLHRAQVRVLVSNDAAVRFWRGLGFVEEGRLRSDTWHDDEPVDALLFSLLAPEYAASRP